MKLHDRLDERLREFVLAQPVFFVGTAPTATDGHVNVSPKGLAGSLAILGDHRVAYLDYTASGAETIAHLRDNGRIVLMFCAFEGPPNIVRLHGTGTPVFVDSPGFDDLLTRFDTTPHPALRAVIDVSVERISDSCGFAVPLLDYQGERDLLSRHNGRRTPENLAEYQRAKNSHSIDGLPALADRPDAGVTEPPA
ncbi:pyridoxamine 5'-phosphate oxidase family protein [Saccharomonospora piscinae]|uniref:Pyridoxamine 5'-phosphate oxidase n=1 Tax=Saccharomonospora piscinae TaxID=687388 RepID=A0A1V8ZYY1_SACPI|nr:pyridoxamine 5'-phosphate oxidase family protein [Saccharomonospora piscinae]OQO89953.1 pyridoxamine 5'-phosphate oxidase [Saccharomonospora piscinae]